MDGPEVFSVSLPTELLLSVISFCSPRTLVAWTSVSRKFLEIVSPLLYNEISIQRPDQLSRLFSKRVKLSDELQPFTSLDQIKRLEIHFPETAPPLPISFSRLSTPTLRLDRLTVVYSHWILWSHLDFLTRLDPTVVHFKYAERARTDKRRLWVELEVAEEVRRISWPSLKCLHLQACVPMGVFLALDSPGPGGVEAGWGGDAALDDYGLIVALREGANVEVTFDLTINTLPNRNGRGTKEQLKRAVGALVVSLEGQLEALGSAVIRVWGEEERAIVVRSLEDPEGFWPEQEMAVLRPKVRVEVDEKCAWPSPDT